MLSFFFCLMFFFFQAEDGIRDLVRSRGLGDVYKRQNPLDIKGVGIISGFLLLINMLFRPLRFIADKVNVCLLYTSDAADERSSVDLGGRRIIKKKNNTTHTGGCKSKSKRTRHKV